MRHVSLLQVLRINESDIVLTLTSGGCNSLNLCLEGAGQVCPIGNITPMLEVVMVHNLHSSTQLCATDVSGITSS